MRREIQAYWGNSRGEHHRYRSWEHCYRYFQQIGPTELCENRHHAALHLAFYLASWGMYRGSSFLLQHAYTVHLGVIDVLGDERFRPLWRRDFGASSSDDALVPVVIELVGALRSAYRPFAPKAGTNQPTDTLLTKVVLGSLGCLPACDRYFINGFKSSGNKFSYFNRVFVERILGFCQAHLAELRKQQTEIMERSGQHYSLMKLTDMYFWQLGMERDAELTAD